MKINKQFPEKRVLITGAGSGLGRSLAVKFGERGWKVGVTDINSERMEETGDLVKKAGGNPLTSLCNVTVQKDIAKVRELLNTAWGGLDILINNAGIVTGGFMEKIPMTDWDWILDTNLKSIIYGCRTFIPDFKKQGWGHIVNVASSAGIASLPEMVPYNVSKAGAISLSETLKVELSSSNIGVTVACPTFFKTNLLDQFTSTDTRQRNMANNLFAKTKTNSDMIADHIINSIKRGRFYSIQQLDGRTIWFFKRHFPETFFKLFAWSYRRGFYDKYVVNL